MIDSGDPGRRGTAARAGTIGHGRCPVIALDRSLDPNILAWPEVLRAAERHALAGGPLSQVGDDSRTVRPGAIFVAHGGPQTDGHGFIPEALAAGAALIVAERPVEASVPVCLVPDGRRALSALAAAWFGYPARRLRMVGITGTNGKTTTVQLAAAVLEAAGLHPSVVGTLGFQHRRDRPAEHLPWTTPPPVELHTWLAQEVDAGTDACVVEVSAQGISQSRVANCAFDVAAITNLARDHREYYASEEEYAEAKAGLFRQLRAVDKPARAVLNRDLPHLRLFRTACAVPIVEYGDGAQVRALSIRSHDLGGTDLLLGLPERPEGIPVRLRLAGRHNVDNSLCAAAIGSALGLAPEAIAAGLEAVRRVPGRLQPVGNGDVRVLVDYAHNPAGLRVLLRLLRTSTPGRLVVVMGARGQRDRGKRFAMGCIVAAFADRVVLTSDRPSGEDPQQAAEPMRLAVADCGVPVSFVADRLQAMALALEGCRAGDCVVAVGKGEEPWEGDSARDGLSDVTALEALQAEHDWAPTHP